jgi:hypothetical protein
MRPVKLCLHTGGEEVAFSAIQKVRTPDATETHFPIPHAELVNRVRVGLSNARLEIVSESHALAKDGDRYFGLFQISKPGMDLKDYSLVMGLRNSHDKRFPAGITVGSQVFVCDNLAFSGEIKLARKHTVNIFRDLPGKVADGIGRLSQAWVSQARRFDAYKETELNDRRDVDSLLVRAIENGAITKTQITDVLNEWRTPTHQDFAPRTVWSLFNAFTEVSKGNLESLTSRTIRLTGLLDGHCGIIDKEPALAGVN